MAEKEDRLRERKHKQRDRLHHPGEERVTLVEVTHVLVLETPVRGFNLGTLLDHTGQSVGRARTQKLVMLLLFSLVSILLAAGKARAISVDVALAQFIVHGGIVEADAELEAFQQEQNDLEMESHETCCRQHDTLVRLRRHGRVRVKHVHVVA